MDHYPARAASFGFPGLHTCLPSGGELPESSWHPCPQGQALSREVLEESSETNEGIREAVARKAGQKTACSQLTPSLKEEASRRWARNEATGHRRGPPREQVGPRQSPVSPYNSHTLIFRNSFPQNVMQMTSGGGFLLLLFWKVILDY